MGNNLNARQKRFCDEYLIDLNGTQAAIRAGYSIKTSCRIASQNLLKLDIQEYIQIRMADRSTRTEITQDMVLKELAHIAFDDIRNYLDFKTEKVFVGYDHEGTPVSDYRTIINMFDSKDIDTRNIAEVSQGPNGTFKFKQYCKDNALIQLGKHLGMFKDKLDVTVSGPIVVTGVAKEWGV